MYVKFSHTFVDLRKLFWKVKGKRRFSVLVKLCGYILFFLLELFSFIISLVL